MGSCRLPPPLPADVFLFSFRNFLLVYAYERMPGCKFSLPQTIGIAFEVADNELFDPRR